MSHIPTIFAGFLTLFGAASVQAISVPAPIPKVAPVQAEQQPLPEWILLGTSTDAKFEIQKSSIIPDGATLSVQFIFRTLFNKPHNVDGHMVSALLERTIVLCRENVLITMDQTQLEVNGTLSSKVEQATVYRNPKSERSAVTAVIDWACTAPKPAAQRGVSI